ncbi:MAG: sugar transferase [Thermodesulfovibrionales bacterium]|nr:sugar transferase [Thermodesulfovibrionales bacterium]
MKRLFDITFSFLGLLLLCPALLFIGALIKKEDRGPVFYRGVRVGRDGRPFKIFKFRTMVVNADKIGGSSTPENDLRITRVGKFLRSYKIDELPQLINVLRGEMSFVGPRPQVQWAVELYSDEEKLLLSVRPGITDYASIRFRNEAEILKGSANPDRDYMEKIAPEKIRLSLEYVKGISLWTDIKIIFLTIKALFQKAD